MYLSSSDGQGATVRDQLLQVQRLTGKPLAELDQAPDLPEAAFQVWSWFTKLNASRGSNGFGPSALSYAEILAFCNLEGIELESWELELIKALDSVTLSHYAEVQKKQQQKQEAKAKAKPSRK